MALTNQQLLDKLNAKFSASIKNTEEPFGFLTIETTKEEILNIISYLKDDQEIQAVMLTDLCGAHFPNDKDREFAVIYHLHSLIHNARIRIKVFLPASNIKIPTLTMLYPGANWMERETYDFFGIIFEGHPNLKRILNEDSMDYFPMRKEYALEDATREDKDDRFFGR